jgi:antitoxin ParD1/3/4
MNIYLGKHFEEMIRKQIESGRYANASEVVREALREYEINEIKLVRLRAMIAEADAQFERGEYTTVTDVRAYIEEKFECAVERAKAKQQVKAHAVAEA